MDENNLINEQETTETLESKELKLKDRIKHVWTFIVLGLVLAALTWLIFWQANQAEESLTSANSAIEMATADDLGATATERQDGVLEELESDLITELDEAEQVELLAIGDEEKLPAITPDSFVEYMRQRLSRNTPDESGCVSLLSIRRISEVNISGNTGSVNPATLEENLGEEAEPLCGGGASSFWYLEKGEWKEFITQSFIFCEDLAEMRIYSEFMASCVSEDGETIDDNPNGSIEDTDI